MIPQIAQPLFDAFKESNEELYLVGGCVRDFFLHSVASDPRICREPLLTPYEPKDLDFATSAHPEKIETILKNMGWPTYPIGIEFGTIATKLAQYDVEITTYRSKESYIRGSRKPSVVFGSSLEDDLKRRDFTVNAMAMGADGKIIDPFCGMMSLMEGILLTPAEDPKIPFSEDPLRMIRGFRFESQLNVGMHKLEYDAIRELKKEIHNISVERIFSEMTKLLMTKKPGETLQSMGECGLLGEIFPELQVVIDFKQNQGKWHSKRVWPHVIDVVDNSPQIPSVRWAALFHDVCKPETYTETETGVHFYQHESKGAYVWNHIADRLKVSTEFKREVNYLIYHHLRFSQLCSVYPSMVSKSALRRFIRDCGPYMDNLYYLSMADITSHRPDVVAQKRKQCSELKEQIDAINKECDITKLKLPTGLGRIIAKELNISHGPELGIIMRRLNDRLVAGFLDDEPDFIAAAKEIKNMQDGLRKLTQISQEIEADGNRRKEAEAESEAG